MNLKLVDMLSNFKFSKLKILSILTGIGLGSIGFKTLQIYLRRRKYRHIPGPKTKGILGFYIGNIVDIINLPKDKIFHDLIIQWANEYGHVFKYQLMDRIVVFTLDPEAIREIFITQLFPKHPNVYGIIGFPLYSRFLGNGLVTDLDHSRWRHRRNLFNPSFHKKSLVGFMEEFNLKSKILMEKFRTLADGKQMISILDEFNNMTMDIIATVGFGMEIDSINKDNQLKNYVFEGLRGFNRALIDPTLKVTFSGWSFIRNYRRLVSNLRGLGKNQILSRIKLIQDGSYLVDDLLTIMLKNNQNEQFDLEILIDDFVTFFVAGQETTANLLAAVLLEIGQKQDIVKKIKDEIDLEIGQKVDLTLEDVNKLRYLGCVIKETLRKWSIVPFMSRMNNVPFKIKNYDIPIGSNIQVSSYVSGHFEEFFPNAELFDPERFYSNKHEIKNYTYIPFGLGARNCIGQNFGQANRS
uniref:Cytochrome p450 CYP3049B6 n=1 Tax=Brachionus calyciflorus TaxID=104777 RepID=A0A2H4PSJ0_9BILA|nr:cytochrome p450 CYP3049B6 [Brachionus calyciflorus]